MGVTGLWRLVEPAGKPVPVETLENKVLAVDISIWLHQVVKGYQDAKGAPLPNAHLMGLFQRLCKLLYFRIKPVFVFDGGFPDLKKETIAKRQDNKNKYHSESERLKRELAVLLSKKTAISSLLGKQISPTKKTNTAQIDNDDLFKLPALPQRDESESESSDDEDTSSGSLVDLHSVDLQSDNFKNMPAKEKYDLLLELKETRKMNSWGKLHTLPKKSDNFSDFQMQRLLKRRKLQECLEETEKEMGDVGMSMNDLESLLNEEGIDTKIESLPTRRIASNNNTRYLLISNVREALAKAKEKKDADNKPQTSTSVERSQPTEKETFDKRDELDDDLQKAIQMSLECVDDPNTSACQSKTDDSWTSFLTDSDYSEASDSEEELEQPDVSTAKAYIMQYSDYTHKAIEKIIVPRLKSGKPKSKVPGVNQVLEELSKEKSIIIDNVALSSSDEESQLEVVNCDESVTTNNEVLNQIGKQDITMDKHVESTEASVKFTDHESDVISLNSSVEKLVDKPETTNATGDSIHVKGLDFSYTYDELQEVPEAQDKLLKSVENIIKPNVARDETANQISVQDVTMDENVESTQASVMFIENTEPDVISLDSSAEEPTEKDTMNVTEDSIEDQKIDSSDTDDEFEEVPEMDAKSRKPVVELMLKIDDVPNDEEDIFADVFSTKGKERNTEIAVKNSNNKNVLLKQKQIHNVIEIKNKRIPEESNALKKESISHVNSVPENSVSTDNVFIDDRILATTEPDTEPIKQTLSAIEQENTKFDVIKDTADNTVQTDSISKTAIIRSVNEELYKPVETNKQVKEPLTDEQLNSMVEEIQNEEKNLIQEKGRLDRIGRNITEQMTKEAQELLQIFGIPYIVAPMEAEAQCAFLESVKLTDGTITDDSDIWLFGGQTVYKNFFNQKKHVLQYISERIEKSFNLSREQLILLALLVGSDYTTGVTGVGPVTAMEILASFPFNKRQVQAETSKQVRYAKLLDGLKEFKVWVKTGKRTDNTSLKKKLRNVTLSDDFPSMRVVQAYLEPNVEKSEDKFTWGELDITVLRDYAKCKFGWSQHKLDEIIKPVLERMKNRKNQKTVHDYFKRTVEFQTLEDQMSKRVKAAVQKMGPEGQIVDENATSETTVKKRKKVVKNIKEDEEAGPSKPKRTKKQIDSQHVIKVVSEVSDGKSSIEINIPKTDRYQEIIPQREKDKQHLLENKMKAIELFRKTKIDRKRKPKKRRPNLPKDKADLSESSSSD